MSMISGDGLAERMEYQSSSTPSPDILSDRKTTVDTQIYNSCTYRHGKYCCSKICTLVFFILFTSITAVGITGLSLYLDNWAGISTNPDATLDLNYPKLGSKYLDYVMFNKTIPNDNGTLYQYIDGSTTSVRLIISRFGLLSHCKSAVTGPRIALFKTPWSAPVCKASWDEYQCPIVAMRTRRGSEPRAPKSRPMNGCIKLTQVCDGTIDCPSGHDEMNCPESDYQCPPSMIKCSASKPICIPKSSVCNGMNDCGMYEDEQNCCGRAGFIRCADGTCVTGERCDAKADCFDLSDEYSCPDPNSEYYSKCSDGQLIESTYRCDGKSIPSFQCSDLSDETRCEATPQPLPNNPALRSPEYDKQSKCFKQTFTFTSLNETMLKRNYPDDNMRKFASKYEYSMLRMAAVASIGANIALTVLSILLLSCMGCVTRRCKSMRVTFIGLALIYLVCILLTLFIGIFWVKYVDALNYVMENPAESDIYERVEIEMVRVTGGFASIRISTNLTFYNCGFFALAFILSIIAAKIVKSASCHRHTSTYEGKFRGPEFQEDILASNKLLSGNHSTTNSDTGTATPEQIVYPHPHSFRSLQKQFTQSASDSQLRRHPMPSGSNTYISYDKVDSIERSHRRSPSIHQQQTRTLDRPPIRYTQV